MLAGHLSLGYLIIVVVIILIIEIIIIIVITIIIIIVIIIIIIIVILIVIASPALGLSRLRQARPGGERAAVQDCERERSPLSDC